MTQGQAPFGVLILHGFTSSLETVNGLVPRVERLGLPYRMPVLRGHGTRPEDLVGVRWRDWVDDAAAGLDDLLAGCERAVVVGLSMGGLCALTLALERPERLAAVVAIAPALRLAGALVPLLPALARLLPWVDVPDNAYTDRELARLNTNYRRVPAATVLELVRFGRAVRERLPEVRTPLLVIGARRDRVVVPASVQEVYDRAGSADRRIVWFERSGHEMLRDLERDAVLDVIERYLSERLAALAPRPQTT